MFPCSERAHGSVTPDVLSSSAGAGKLRLLERDRDDLNMPLNLAVIAGPFVPILRDRQCSPGTRETQRLTRLPAAHRRCFPRSRNVPARRLRKQNDARPRETDKSLSCRQISDLS